MFKAGFATIDITPPVGTYLAGFASRNKPSDGVYHPLRGTVFVLCDDSNQAAAQDAIIIINAEWLGFYEHTSAIRDALCKELSIQPSQLILSATHTHCGPAIRELDLSRHGTLDESYIKETIQKFIDCAISAWNKQEVVMLKAGKGICDIAVSRRRPNDAGGVDFAPYAGGLHDHDVFVLGIYRETGALRGVVFNYACHPTCNQSIHIGGDYVGYAMEALEHAYPECISLFMQGCAGDQKVKAVNEAQTHFQPLQNQEIPTYGNKLAQSVMEILEHAMQPVEGALHIQQMELYLHGEPATEERVQRSLALFKDNPEYAQKFSNLIKDNIPLSSVIPLEIQLITLSNACIMITISAEIVVHYALRLKELLSDRFDHILIAGYCNDIIGYICSNSQIPQGGYEVDGWMDYYPISGLWIQETEDYIITSIYERIQQMES